MKWSAQANFSRLCNITAPGVRGIQNPNRTQREIPAKLSRMIWNIETKSKGIFFANRINFLAFLVSLHKSFFCEIPVKKKCTHYQNIEDERAWYHPLVKQIIIFSALSNKKTRYGVTIFFFINHSSLRPSLLYFYISERGLLHDNVLENKDKILPYYI